MSDNPLDEAGWHREKIICPACGEVQDAVVYDTKPWACYVHECTDCKYLIMESEWELSKD